MPEGAVYVGRPTRWGNPYSATTLRFHLAGEPERASTPAEQVDLYRRELTCDEEHGWDEHSWTRGLNLTLLRGADLACWCPLDQPCHADVLLELANPDDHQEAPHGRP
ncbi:DUF4326 domain-containing protein [Rhodococcus aerolatus]